MTSDPDDSTQGLPPAHDERDRPPGGPPSPSGQTGRTTDPLISALRGFEAGNIAMADILARRVLERGPDAAALNLLGRIGDAIGERETAARLFREALHIDPHVPAAAENLRAVESAPPPAPRPTPAYAVIHSWGSGFWADVDHVLAQLVVCEMNGRTPLVHWGRSCLYGGGSGRNAWEFYFKPCSGVRPEDLVGKGHRFYPERWNEGNFLEEDLKRITAPPPRIMGLHLLNRAEEVVVADIHTDIVQMLPWVRPGHRLFGRSLDDVYRDFARTHLRLRTEISDEIERSAYKLLRGPMVAVHFRGTDKIRETPGLRDLARQYPPAIERMLAAVPGARVFLISDDADAERGLRQQFGPRLVTTDSVRASGPVGLHFRKHPDRVRLGTEVIRDVYLAARCEAFVGLGGSSVSRMVHHLKQWPAGRCILIGDTRHRQANLALHTPGMLEQLRTGRWRSAPRTPP